MSQNTFTPVFTVLRYALHALVIGLSILVAVRAVTTPVPGTAAGRVVVTMALAAVFLATYLAGAMLGSPLTTRHGTHTSTSPVATMQPTRGQSHRMQYLWLIILCAEWATLIVLSTDAAFLVFPLFFLILHLVRLPWSIFAVVLATALAIVTLARHSGWTVGGVTGPIVGAAVAVAISLGYQALFREVAARNRLIDELISTRAQLAASEREKGMLAERSRLAREIHDTVAQGLSSIQLLLHAAELESPTSPSNTHIRLARETASLNLQEARRFIAELTPPALQEQSLAGAIERLASSITEVTVNFRVSGTPVQLPMPIETALLRIAQGSLSNVVQHSNAAHADITLTYMGDSIALDIVDNGDGFDTDIERLTRDTPDRQAFGLDAIESRANQLGGNAAIESTPGKGTALAVSIPLIEIQTSQEQSI